MSGTIFNDINPNTTSGTQLATLLNDFKDAVVSGFTGTSRPTNLQDGGYWIDVTNDPTSWDYYLFDGTDDILIFTIDLATGTATIGNASSLFQITKTSNDAVGALLRLIKARVSGGGQTLANDVLGEVQFLGTDDGGDETLQAKIVAVTQNNTTDSSQGSYLSFQVTTINTSSLAEVFRLIDDKVGIGITAPTDKLHVRGNSVRWEKRSDDAVGIKVNAKKSRIASNGQVQNNDIIAEYNALSTDDAGTELNAFQIEVKANQNHTSTAHGTTATFRTKKAGQTTFTDQLELAEEVTVKTSFAVQSAKFKYDNALASKVKVGAEGAEAEVATVSHTQTLTNKTITGASIQTPTRLDVKQGTESALTTYASSASNGQWCFATDTKVMYQVIDGALVPAGSGGGGVSLDWKLTGLSPAEAYVNNLDLLDFNSSDTQEIFAVLKVPQSYRTGKPIKLKAGKFFCSSTTGKVFFKATTTLLNSSTVLGTYPNTFASTNTVVTVSGVANTTNLTGDIDLTSSTGQINSVSVQPGDDLLIRLYRDVSAESGGAGSAASDARLLKTSMEPTFS